MPYDRQIPDAPIALSMLPRLEDLQVGIEHMEGIDLTSIYTTIGGVLGTPAHQGRYAY